MNRFLLASAALLSACAGRASELPFYRSATMTPEWLKPAEAAAPSMHRVRSFALTDQNGGTIDEHAFGGKATIVHFFFTSCGDICPNTTRNISDLLATFAPDAPIQVLSYSVTPDHDSASVLKTFAALHGITDRRWHFLTGKKSLIDDLARSSFFVSVGSGTNYGVDSIAHTETLLLVDGAGRVRGVYAGMLALEVARLGEDARVLLRGRRGT